MAKQTFFFACSVHLRCRGDRCTKGIAWSKYTCAFHLKKTKMSLRRTTTGEEAVMIASLPFVMTPFVLETEAARAPQFWDLCVRSDDNTVCYTGNKMIEESVCAYVPQRAQTLYSTTNIYLSVYVFMRRCVWRRQYCDSLALPAVCMCTY